MTADVMKFHSTLGMDIQQGHIKTGEIHMIAFCQCPFLDFDHILWFCRCYNGMKLGEGYMGTLHYLYNL